MTSVSVFPELNRVFKLVLLGDSGVGKSSIGHRYITNEFSHYVPSTIGASFLTKSFNYQGYQLKLDIWDTAGQERYHCLAPLYYRGSNAVIIACDVTQPESFKSVELWLKQLHQHFAIDKLPLIYVAINKMDLCTLQPDFTYVKNLCEQYQCKLFKVSAKTGFNIENLFNDIIADISVLFSQQRQLHPMLSNKHTVEINQSNGSRSRCCF